MAGPGRGAASVVLGRPESAGPGTAAGSCELGLVGLGVMGRNLALNMAERGFAMAGYDRDPERVEALRREAAGKPAFGASGIGEFLRLLRRPRAVLMLVPAGPAVDSVIADLSPDLRAGDLLVDAGNSHFKDTEARARRLAKDGILFMGVGVSGGEEGARRGPSIMPGGPREAYERVRPVFEAVAAAVDGEPCVEYLGPGSVGHFVKMAHNGIEYGLMQLVSETYDLMKRGLVLDDDELARIYGSWNEGELRGYLMEITSRIFRRVDKRTGKRLVDKILDAAKQKGTGRWTSQTAMDLEVPVPAIDAAVSMRSLSGLVRQRELAAAAMPGPARRLKVERGSFLEELRRALYAGTLMVYAQGLALLSEASQRYGWRLDLQSVARIWRGGCIIRAAALDDIRAAYRDQPGLPNLLLDPELAKRVGDREEDLRRVISAAVDLGLPVPAFMACLGYLDAYRSSWLPANLVQAQRDYFGAHAYERVDRKGTFHTEWEGDGGP